jgi:ADP-heptose:LPS heptosyltransferase
VPTDGHQNDPADLADSAGIIATLDMLITVDTFTAHLAGAMGKPVCLALSTVADWRWMTDRVDTPWYPATRLFRQKSLNDWPELFGRIAASLRSWELISS